MANRAGECWPSLGQLSDRIGRSRAAISGYIAELRETDLLETSTQKMANGYNYRLKYCVTFWKSWRARLVKPTAQRADQKSECSVQPSERRVNSKNHNHKKQPFVDSAFSELFSTWKSHAGIAPFPHFQRPVKPELIAQTQHLLAGKTAHQMSGSEVKQALKTLWSSLGVELQQGELRAQCWRLTQAKISKQGFECFKSSVLSTWQDHWKKPPTSEQFEALLGEAQKLNREEGMLKMLEQYLKRWEISQKKLQRSGASRSLAFNRAA